MPTVQIPFEMICPTCGEIMPAASKAFYVGGQGLWHVKCAPPEETPFYRELATRVMALANSLQYENASKLLQLTLSASDDGAPEVLAEASTAMEFAFRQTFYDHETFDTAIDSLESWLKEN